MAKFLFDALNKNIKDISGILTSYEKNGKICVLTACDEIERPRLEFYLQNAISNLICTHFKEMFLNKQLVLPHKSEIELVAFKKALISFDRETDKYLINKFLVLTNNLEVESFFYFKLKPLKEKWKELVNIANDNSTYLLGEDSFVELLKFLIDNIDIAKEEVFVTLKGDDVQIFDEGQEQNLSKVKLVEYLMTESPRKINWDADTPDLFLEKIFSKRIVYGACKRN